MRGAPQPRFAAAMRLPARPDPRERDPEEAVRMSQAQARVAAFEDCKLLTKGKVLKDEAATGAES